MHPCRYGDDSNPEEVMRNALESSRCDPPFRMSEHFWPSWRRIYEQSWWIASELARRQSRLRIVETHPGDGMYDCLHLGDDGAGFGTVGTVALNRHGTLHAEGSNTENLTWADALAAGGPHDIVHELERRMRWKVTSADPTTARSLAYRGISRLLTRVINERDHWTVRQVSPGNSWLDFSEDDLVHEFPQASGIRGELAVDRPGLWAVLKDDKVVELVGENGLLFRRGQDPLDLMTVYRTHKRIDNVVDQFFEI
jgi:hypothetical protein